MLKSLFVLKSKMVYYHNVKTSFLSLTLGEIIISSLK